MDCIEKVEIDESLFEYQQDFNWFSTENIVIRIRCDQNQTRQPFFLLLKMIISGLKSLSIDYSNSAMKLWFIDLFSLKYFVVYYLSSSRLPSEMHEMGFVISSPGTSDFTSTDRMNTLIWLKYC